MKTSDIKKIFNYIFYTSEIDKDLSLLKTTEEEDYLSLKLRDDLDLEEHDFIILYLNTCSVLKSHKLNLHEFEKAITLNDLYELIKINFT